jgi:REP element-mobilizing transposase RayT
LEEKQLARPLRVHYEGAFYHVMARGQRAEKIFINDKDREEFLERLEVAINKYNVHLHAYCLMDNHYHFLLETPLGNLSQMMRYFNGSYANYFRIKHKLIGSVFQGRYKSILVEKDDYLLKLSAYIHLNPVRAKITEIPETYKWSSFKYYAGTEDSPEWLFTEELGKYGDNYINVVYDQFQLSDEELSELTTSRKSVLGSDALVSYALEIAENRKGIDKEIELPEFKELKRVNKEKIFQIVESLFSVKREDFLSKRYENIHRSLCIYGMKRYTGMKLNEIADVFSLKYPSVSSNYKNFIGKSETSEKIMDMKEKIDKAIKKI